MACFRVAANVHQITTGGTVDGNGQAWYDLYAADIFTLRPVLFGIDGLNNTIISGLNLQYSPQYYHFVANSSNVIFDNINISGQSVSKNSANNTDGWDTYRSRDITIMNSVIDNVPSAPQSIQATCFQLLLPLTNAPFYRLCLVQAEQYRHPCPVTGL